LKTRAAVTHYLHAHNSLHTAIMASDQEDLVEKLGGIKLDTEDTADTADASSTTDSKNIKDSPSGSKGIKDKSTASPTGNYKDGKAQIINNRRKDTKAQDLNTRGKDKAPSINDALPSIGSSQRPSTQPYLPSHRRTRHGKQSTSGSTSSTLPLPSTYCISSLHNQIRSIANMG
jgi:hypothetical protein